jgi:hypothetical protein
MSDVNKEKAISEAVELLKGLIPEAINEASVAETEKTDWVQEKLTWLIVFIGGLIAFIFDYLCNEVPSFQKYSIISFVFTLITSLIVGFKFFDYATPQINFFSNWKGNKYEILAKALVISAILFVLGVAVHSAANSNVSGATSPQEPSRIETIIEKQIIKDSTETNRDSREPESEQ